MKALLAIEWLKIKSYRTFWIISAFFLVLLPLWNYQVMNGMIKFGGSGKDSGINILNQAYSFPEVWGNMGFWGSIFVMFLSILVIILTTNEYTFRTHRQNIIDGWNRLDFFHAKVWLVVLISFAATVYMFLIGLLLGLTNSGGYFSFDQMEKLAYFFLLTVNYLGFALLIGIWIKRSGLAIGIFILYCLIIENILRGVLNWKLDFSPGNYLPLQASDELLPFPLLDMMKTMLKPEAIPYNNYIIVTILWCCIYYFIGRRLLLRSDW